eukprot:1156890-Pelagomonas_calceolata.AAC.6
MHVQCTPILTTQNLLCMIALPKQKMRRWYTLDLKLQKSFSPRLRSSFQESIMFEDLLEGNLACTGRPINEQSGICRARLEAKPVRRKAGNTINPLARTTKHWGGGVNKHLVAALATHMYVSGLSPEWHCLWWTTSSEKCWRCTTRDPHEPRKHNYTAHS